MNRDLVTNIDALDAGMAAMHIVTAMQDMRPEQQIIGLTAAFMFLLESKGFPVQDAMSIATHAMYTKDGGLRPEFYGAKAYVENEL